jgi:hypothetical protein
MRLIVISNTPERLRVVYRWLEDPFAAARPLLDGPTQPGEQLRLRLEAEILGEMMTPAEYRLVVNASAAADMQRAFPEFRIESAADPWSPDQASERLYPPDLKTLLKALEARVAPLSPVPAEARESLAALRSRFRILAVGHSLRALEAVRQAPVPAGVEVVFHDLRRSPGVEWVQTLPFRLVAVSGSPGMGRDERILLEGARSAVVALFEAAEAEKPDASTQRLSAVLGSQVPIVGEPARALSLLAALVRAEAGAALSAWMDRFVLIPVGGDQADLIRNIRATLERFASAAD